MHIHCQYDKILSPDKLKPHPKNRNIHSDNQIERLAKLLKYQGIRAPVVVSKLSGFIVKGHGTLKAIIKNKGKKVPVSYQEFESKDQEYAFIQSDNAIASWAELDIDSIKIDTQDLSFDFDMDLLGLKDFCLSIDKQALDDKPENIENKEEIHILEVQFSSMPEMIEVYDDLLSRGLIVRCKTNG